MHFNTFFSALIASGLTTVLADASISSFPNALTLSTNFDPIKAAYWTGLPHHRRTPFSVSPDGNSAYIAYLDSTYKNIQVQQVDTTKFTAVGDAVSIPGFEAGGLVAQNDGFALLATINATGTIDLPPDGQPIVSLIRYKDGKQAWNTPLNGPGVHAADGLTATPDANGDLVYSSSSGLYAAYFVVTAYTGDASGHFGDSVQYVNGDGELQDIPEASTFGCSHNTGIGLEDADEVPFASVCAEDHGAIWLNTDTRYMSGVKIANENTTNGVSGEPMGGMSGSYSNLARFPSTSKYMFAWQSRGAVDLYTDTWMGAPYTQCAPRWLNHNVAIASLSSKDTLAGKEATSEVGATDGDSQVNWITDSTTEDHQNVHVAALGDDLALVTWETLSSPDCQPVPLSCSGTYAGTSFQFVDASGAKVGEDTTSKEVFVSGDIVTVGDKLCWPYVDMTWDLSQPKSSGTPVSKMSFACASSENSTASAGTASSVSEVASTAAATPVESSGLASTVAGADKQVETSAVSSLAATTPAAAASSSLSAGESSAVAETSAVASTVPLTSMTASIPTTLASVVIPSPTQDVGDDDTCI